ncbi:MAG TPA: DUF3566 domain-containing protein [Acidimicrobiia bacterium]|nr:DUF3566 domain-containing protein [Acidimicrobiia bacterium]
MSSLPGRGMTSSQPPLGDWLRDPDIEVMKRPDRRTVVLRRIDLWSALKVSLGLYFSLFLVALAALMLLWLAARSTGFLDNVESLVEDFGMADEDTFHFQGAEILKMTAVIGPILVVLGSLATVAGVALFNALSRLFGGVEVTVFDGEELPPG